VVTKPVLVALDTSIHSLGNGGDSGHVSTLWHSYSTAETVILIECAQPGYSYGLDVVVSCNTGALTLAVPLISGTLSLTHSSAAPLSPVHHLPGNGRWRQQPLPTLHAYCALCCQGNQSSSQSIRQVNWDSTCQQYSTTMAIQPPEPGFMTGAALLSPPLPLPACLPVFLPLLCP
jgi:hypothetical protein